MKFSHKAKQLGIKHYDVNMGMMDFDVRFIIGDYKKSLELVEWFHEVKYYAEEPGDPPRGEMFYTPPFCAVIWLPHKPRTADEHGTLAHECVHAVSRMFQWASVPHDLSTDEPFAHAVGFLVRQFKEKVK